MTEYGGFLGGGFHEHGDWRWMVENQEEVPRPILKKKEWRELEKVVIGPKNER